MLLLLSRSSSLQPHFLSPRCFSLALNLECQIYDIMCDSMVTNWCHKYIIILFFGVCVWIESWPSFLFQHIYLQPFSWNSRSWCENCSHVYYAAISVLISLLKPFSDTPPIHSWLCTSSGIVKMNRKCICGFKNCLFLQNWQLLDSWDSILVVKFCSELCFSVWLTFMMAKTLKETTVKAPPSGWT